MDDKELSYEDRQQALNDAFLFDFKQLLKKYNAQIFAKDEYMGYPECGEDIHIYVEGHVTSDYKPFVMVDLGSGI